MDRARRCRAAGIVSLSQETLIFLVAGWWQLPFWYFVLLDLITPHGGIGFKLVVLGCGVFSLLV